MPEPPSARFVVQHHTGHRGDHFDLMIEHAGTLLTWQIEQDLPAAAASFPARRLPDHRLSYLTYEGEVSGGRGRCHIVQRGMARWIEQTPSRLVIEFMVGDARLTVTLGQIDGERWQLDSQPA